MNIAILAALEAELGDCFNDLANVFYTGVGKINAASVTTEVIMRYKPKSIINFGTAASAYYPKGHVIRCGYYFQRDMDCSLLGLPLGETFGDTDQSFCPKSYNPKHEPVVAACYSGDSFLDSNQVKLYYPAVVDMEAYAIAKVAHRFKVNFVSFKVISDGIGKDSATEWKEAISQGAPLFRKLYESLEAVS